MPSTRKTLRTEIRRLVGDGIDASGDEDTTNAAYPNNVYNEQINKGMAEVASLCESLRSLTGLDFKNFTWPADTEALDLTVLGITSYKIDSLWRMTDDWTLLDRVVEADHPDALAWTGFDRQTSSGTTDWTNPRYTLLSGSRLLLRPIPSTALKLQIRYPGSGAVRLLSDPDELPPQFFFHPVVEQMVVHMVCRKMDKRPGAAERWQAEVDRGLSAHPHLFSPPRQHTLSMRGFRG